MIKFFLIGIFFLQAQNVGIGTTTPQSQLHIGNSGANELIISCNKYAVGFTHCI